MAVAWPLFVMQGSMSLMLFCDRMFLSRHGVVSLLAALPAGILAFTLVCGFQALVSFTNSFVAQFYGAGDRVGCVKATSQGLWAALLSYPVLLLLIPVGYFMIGASGHSAEVQAAERPYFTILILGSLPGLLYMGWCSFYSGQGRTKLPMYTALLSNGVNVFLDYALIFGRCGFPELGMPGAAWATVIAHCFGPLVMAWCYYGPEHKRFETRRHMAFDRTLFLRLLRFGTPAGIHQVVDVAAFAVFVFLIGKMDVLEAAASNIVLSINLIAFLPLIGLGIGAATLVGQCQGDHAPEEAARVGWRAARMGVVYMIGAIIVFNLIPGWFFGLFAGRANAVPLEDVLPVGRPLIWVISAWGLADVAVIILGGALRGAGDTRFVMYFSSTMAIVMLACGQWVLVNYFHAGMLLSWCWTAFYIVLLGGGYLWRFAEGHWKKVDLLGRRESHH